MNSMPVGTMPWPMMSGTRSMASRGVRKSTSRSEAALG